MTVFLGTQNQVQVSHGKRAIGVRVIGFTVYMFLQDNSSVGSNTRVYFDAKIVKIIFQYLCFLVCFTGFDGNVYIFKRKVSSQDENAEPLFKHEGHVMNQDDQSNPLLVVKHLWHPWQQDLVMSAATDGSLHAWQYQLNDS